MTLKFWKKQEKSEDRWTRKYRMIEEMKEVGIHEAVVMVGMYAKGYQMDQVKPKLISVTNFDKYTKYSYTGYRRESDPENFQRYTSRKNIWGEEFIGLVVGHDCGSFDFSNLVKALAEVRTDLPEAVPYVFTSFD